MGKKDEERVKKKEKEKRRSLPYFSYWSSLSFGDHEKYERRFSFSYFFFRSLLLLFFFLVEVEDETKRKVEEENKGKRRRQKRFPAQRTPSLGHRKQEAKWKKE